MFGIECDVHPYFPLRPHKPQRKTLKTLNCIEPCDCTTICATQLGQLGMMYCTSLPLTYFGVYPSNMPFGNLKPKEFKEYCTVTNTCHTASQHRLLIFLEVDYKFFPPSST